MTGCTPEHGEKAYSLPKHSSLKDLRTSASKHHSHPWSRNHIIHVPHILTSGTNSKMTENLHRSAIRTHDASQIKEKQTERVHMREDEKQTINSRKVLKECEIEDRNRLTNAKLLLECNDEALAEVEYKRSSQEFAYMQNDDLLHGIDAKQILKHNDYRQHPGSNNLQRLLISSDELAYKGQHKNIIQKPYYESDLYSTNYSLTVPTAQGRPRSSQHSQFSNSSSQNSSVYDRVIPDLSRISGHRGSLSFNNDDRNLNPEYFLQNPGFNSQLVLSNTKVCEKLDQLNPSYLQNTVYTILCTISLLSADLFGE